MMRTSILAQLANFHQFVAEKAKFIKTIFTLVQQYCSPTTRKRLVTEFYSSKRPIPALFMQI